MRKKMDLKAYALWLLGAREYSESRLRAKCTEKYPEQAEAIETLIEELKAKRFLDDDRFCEVMIRSEVRKGNGPSKIMAKLIQKGINVSQAKKAVEQYTEKADLFEAVWTMAKKKKLQLEKKYPEASEFECQQKLMQYLAGRGYDYELIREAL